MIGLMNDILAFLTPAGVKSNGRGTPMPGISGS